MHRRVAEYRPGPRRRARVRLFQSVHLNAVGWAAVAALCLSGAALGYATGRLLHAPGGPAALVVALTVMGCLIVLDRRRSARLR